MSNYHMKLVPYFLLVTFLVWSAAAVEPPLHQDGPFDPAEAEAEWRWIGVLPEPAAPCPVPVDPSWSSQKLFEDPALSLWPELGRFCVYQYELEQPPPETLDTLVNTDLFVSLGRDRMALTRASGPSLADHTWRDLAAHFDRQVEAVGTLPSGEGVRLVLLDTSPTTGVGNGPENSVHGETLGHLVRRMLCPDDVCPESLEIRTRLTLAYNSFDKNVIDPSSRSESQGGSFGLVSELAEAILDELTQWRLEGRSGGRLILNLSVAWDPVFVPGQAGIEAGPAKLWPADVQSVYEALRVAACEGALAVAAAGNRSDRILPFEGPKYPARWAFDAVPNDDPRCPAGWEAGEPLPLIISAGGVDGLGRPLTNARPGSAPALAAYADHAVTEEPTATGTGTPTGTPILTGSSVAAAVVSSNLAVVALYRPDLDARELLQLVYDAGELLPDGSGGFRQQDPCWLGGPSSECQRGITSPWVRYVSLCRSFALACTGGQGSCPPPPFPACGQRVLGEPELTSDLSAFSAVATTLDAAGLITSFTPQGSVCTLADDDFWPLYQAGFRPDDPCPDLQRYGSSRRPWNVPQPNDDFCPPCNLRTETVTSPLVSGGGSSSRTGGPVEGVLYVEIDPGLTATLSDPTLTVLCGGMPHAFSLNHGVPWVAGSKHRIVGLPAFCEAAWLSVTATTLDGSTTSISTPILISY